MVIRFSCVVLVISCGGDDNPLDLPLPDAEVRYRTKYVDIAPLSDSPVCAGTLKMMDDHIEYMLDVLGLQLTRRISMFLVHPGEAAEGDWCDDWTMNDIVAGCYLPTKDVILTNFGAIPHELIHAITSEIGHSWWTEGIAYGFSPGVPDVPDFSSGWSDVRGDSGHLSRWLVERYGGDTFVELFEHSMPRHADRATVEAAVRDVLGSSFTEVLSEYAATSAYVYPDYWSCYVPQGVAESLWIGDYWESEVVLDCTQKETFSRDDFTQKQGMTARIPVTIPRAGPYHFLADHPDAELFMQPCPTDPLIDPMPEAYKWPIPLNPLNVGAPTFQEGPHVLLVHIPPGDPTTVGLIGYLSVD